MLGMTREPRPPMKMKAAAIAAYVLALHAAVLTMALRSHWKPSPGDAFVAQTRAIQAQAAIPPGSVVLLGDSNMQVMPPLIPGVVNFGIAWQRSDQLLESVAVYRHLSGASAIVVMIGTNDQRQGRASGIDARYVDIVRALPPGVPIVMVSPPPMADMDASGLRLPAQHACQQRSDCVYVDAFGALSYRGALSPDGLHLSPSGFATLAGLISEAVHQIPRSTAMSTAPGSTWSLRSPMSPVFVSPSEFGVMKLSPHAAGKPTAVPVLPAVSAAPFTLA